MKRGKVVMSSGYKFIVKFDDGWKVINNNGYEKAFYTMLEAVEFVKGIAKNYEAEVIVEKEDGEIYCKRNYKKGFCSICGTKLTKENRSDSFMCINCKSNKEELNKFEKFKKINMEKKKVDIQISTTDTLEGYTIEKYIDVINSECIMGTGFFNEISAGISDTMGNRISSYEEVLRQCQEIALNKLKEKAIYMGGNGLIGVRFSCSTASQNAIFIVMMGTVVKVSKVQELLNDN